MSYNLFLDDERSPKSAYGYMHLPIYLQAEWIIVRNYCDFISLIQNNGVPNLISFDHDLADEHYRMLDFNYDAPNLEKTGYHCAKWLIDYCLDNNKELPKQIIIHSMNPYGSENIKSLFETFFKVYEIDYNPIPLNPYFKQLPS